MQTVILQTPCLPVRSSHCHTYIFQKTFKTHSCFFLPKKYEKPFLKAKFLSFHMSNRLTVREDLLPNCSSSEVIRCCKFTNFKCSAHNLSLSVQHVHWPLSLSFPFCHSPQFSVILIPHFYSNTFFSSHFSDFCSSSPCGGVKWLWLQLQTLCMLKKDNNLQLVRLIVNFSVLMHLGWPYFCIVTRNVNDIPLLCAQSNQPQTLNLYSLYTSRNHLQSWWADYHEDLYQGFWDQYT